MLDILRKFFRFCDERERKEFYISIGLGVAAASFSAMKIPAIGVMLQAISISTTSLPEPVWPYSPSAVGAHLGQTTKPAAN